MAGSHDLQITDIDHYLGAKMIISHRDIDHCSRFSAFPDILLRLALFHIIDYAVDHLTDILIGISHMPFCYVIIICASHICHFSFMFYFI